jgi:hypothetical protein
MLGPINPIVGFTETAFYASAVVGMFVHPCLYAALLIVFLKWFSGGGFILILNYAARQYCL